MRNLKIIGANLVNLAALFPLAVLAVTSAVLEGVAKGIENIGEALSDYLPEVNRR